MPRTVPGAPRTSLLPTIPSSIKLRSGCTASEYEPREHRRNDCFFQRITITMAKFGLFATLVAIVGALTFASTSEPMAADACQHKDFKTEMVKNACAKGGQAEAKEVMKKFNKDNKIK